MGAAATSCLGDWWALNPPLEALAQAHHMGSHPHRRVCLVLVCTKCSSVAGLSPLRIPHQDEACVQGIWEGVGGATQPLRLTCRFAPWECGRERLCRGCCTHQRSLKKASDRMVGTVLVALEWAHPCNPQLSPQRALWLLWWCDPNLHS